MPNPLNTVDDMSSGAVGLRVDLLAEGSEIDQLMPVPELNWHARTMPQCGYLLHDARHVAMLTPTYRPWR